jgi:hypothetical protein
LSPFPQPGFDSSGVSVGGGDDCGGGGGEDAAGGEGVDDGCDVSGGDEGDDGGGDGLGAGSDGGFGAGGFGGGFDECGGLVGCECCALCVVGGGAATRVAASWVGVAC